MVRSICILDQLQAINYLLFLATQPDFAQMHNDSVFPNLIDLEVRESIEALAISLVLFSARGYIKKRVPHAQVADPREPQRRGALSDSYRLGVRRTLAHIVMRLLAHDNG